MMSYQLQPWNSMILAMRREEGFLITYFTVPRGFLHCLSLGLLKVWVDSTDYIQILNSIAEFQSIKVTMAIFIIYRQKEKQNFQEGSKIDSFHHRPIRKIHSYCSVNPYSASSLKRPLLWFFLLLNVFSCKMFYKSYYLEIWTACWCIIHLFVCKLWKKFTKCSGISRI